MDAPFEWTMLDAYGLPWETSAYLLELWVYVLEKQALVERGASHLPEEFQLPPMPVPTARDARWWWRVHLAAPQLNQQQVWILGWTIALRELRHEVLLDSSDMKDLEAYLAYKPWESKEAKARYQRAIARGIIGPLQTEPSDLANAIGDPDVDHEGIWVPNLAEWNFSYFKWMEETDERASS